MFHTSMNSKTTITLSTLAIAAIALFVSGPILGNQQALAANAAGGRLGGSNVGNVGHLYLGGLPGYPYFGGYPGYGGYPYITGYGYPYDTGYGNHSYDLGYGGYPYYYHHHHHHHPH
jgi:hypothetical protein